MTDLLKQALIEAEKLPESEQNALARWLLTELSSERKWDESFSDSQNALTKLAEEAKKEYGKGETKPLDPDNL